MFLIKSFQSCSERYQHFSDKILFKNGSDTCKSAIKYAKYYTRVTYGKLTLTGLFCVICFFVYT